MKDDTKFQSLVHALRNVDADLGMYPQAVRGYGDERDYEQRDGYKNGWNAAIMAHGAAFDAIVERASEGFDDNVAMLTAADVGYQKEDGSFLLVFNDTWSWASADAEIVASDEISEVARLYRSWGWAGLLYWATTKHPGLRSEFKDNNRFIDFVAREEAFIKAVPESNKRAYMELPS